MRHTEYIVPIGEEAKDYDEIFIGVIRTHSELIRCKDCKYRNDRFYCTLYHQYHRLARDMEYCSDGRRRDE